MESERMASEVRNTVNQIGMEARKPDVGRALRNPQTVRDILSEEMAWALICGAEPRLGVDAEGSFYTITGKQVLSDATIDFMGAFGMRPATAGLMPMQKETLDPTIPPDRWRTFLVTDERALKLLGGIERLAGAVSTPQDFSLRIFQMQGRTPPDLGDTLVSRVRGLAGLISSRDPQILEPLAELCWRRSEYVWGPGGDPWSER